jgi:hypothetical protein
MIAAIAGQSEAAAVEACFISLHSRDLVRAALFL